MSLQKGDNVRYSKAMLEQYSPKRRVRAEGRRGVVSATPHPESLYVRILWNGCINPVLYHECLIELAEFDSINWNEIRSSVKRQFEKTLEYLGNE